jgi:UDP-N-acetylmuramate dehydrogenase
MIEKDISLKPYNTFGIDVKAKYFSRFDSVDQLTAIFKEFDSIPFLIIGGGSNLLLTKDFDGIVLRNEILGKTIKEETAEHVVVKVGGGENWHEFVLWAVEKNFGGIENMSLIPGSVGASPMQNIGAYGVEIKHTFDSLEAIELDGGTIKTFSHAECKFGYRESVFKQEAKGKYIILSVTFKLSKQPNFNTTYGAIQQTLQKNGVVEPSVKAISDAVIEIRSSKLPNPKVLGNAGSFFKNPEIPNVQFASLKQQFPDIVGYPASEG